MIGRLPVCCSIACRMVRIICSATGFAIFGLLVARAAPVDEVVGAAHDAGATRAFPVLGEAGVDVVAAFRRLDEGEVGSGGTDRCPVDLALIARYVDAVDGQALRLRDARMRLGVGELAGPSRAGR